MRLASVGQGMDNKESRLLLKHILNFLNHVSVLTILCLEIEWFGKL